MSHTAAEPVEFLLLGNPNSGKTTLFNRLTGARAKVGNYPGVTVERAEGRVTLPDVGSVLLHDLPGTYSLTARSLEEKITATAVLEGDGRRVLVVVVDATAVARGLYLAVQLAETGQPLVVALNMMDEATAAGLSVDTTVLSQALGADVVAISASKGEGIDALRAALGKAASRDATYRPVVPALDRETLRWVGAVAHALGPAEADGPDALRVSTAKWVLLAPEAELASMPQPVRDAVTAAHGEAQARGVNLDEVLIGARYRFIDELVARSVTGMAPAVSLTDRIDNVLTHRVWGLGVFALVMLVVFQALFSWSSPMIDLIQEGVAAVQTLATEVLPDGPLRGLLVDGVIAGVGNVVVFVPQIALLFFFIGVLEDSGYLARVAFVLDRVMGGIGLHGKAFVPMLSGFACAIPAVMATRTIEDRKDRLLTMMVVPLMSCSARLPIYVLVTATVFAGSPKVFGILSMGAVVLLAMYGLSVLATLGAAAVLRRTVLRGPRPTLVLELPPYRAPTARNIALGVMRRVQSFLADAGTIILALTILLWALLSYPKNEGDAAHIASLRRDAETTLVGEAQAERLASIDGEEASLVLRHSAAGRLGKVIEPAIAPLGMDWRMGIGVLGAFAAREVFVSTLGIVFGISNADETSVPLHAALTGARHADGTKLLTPLSGVALMVFFVLACQCMSTLAVVRRESGSWKWPVFLFAYMSVLAYVAALIVYQGGRALGLG